jgi:Lon protease-like protein
MGCAGVIIASEQLPDGRYNIVLRGLMKFRILSEDLDRSYRLASVEAVSDGVPTSERSLLPQSREELEEVFRTAFPNAQLSFSDMSDAEVIDGLSLVVPIEPTERQELLEADGPVRRASGLVSLLRQRFRIAP